MSIAKIIFLYMLALLTCVGVLSFLRQIRKRSFGFMGSADHIFRCEGCGYVYTDDPDVDRSRCPQCGQMNDVYKF